MAPNFGTSGLRGLVTELTPDLIARYVQAFVRLCPIGHGLYVGRDLRPSSPEIAAVVIQAARQAGIPVTDCAAVPTPALALASMAAGAAAIMVTGSHIPADRNGLKFYLPGGEITKADEAQILSGLALPPACAELGQLTHADPGPLWVARYVTAFGPEALQGLRIGLWAQSAVSRDLLAQTLRDVGAEVIEIDRADHFIPVDTEAVPHWAREKIRGWCQEHRLDALVSTDGDGDRPLLADARGEIVPGDLLGQITARVVGADHIVTPISSNSGVQEVAGVKRVLRTKIGSPFVIAGMEDLRGQELGGRVIGYEANGGFLLGFAANLPAGALAPLATRDSLLPLIAPLSLARAAGGVAALVAQEPPRVTKADRLEEIPTEGSRALIASLTQDHAALATFLAALGETPAQIDLTDGLRISTGLGRVVHLRPSGNAPELRLYIEAETGPRASEMLAQGLQALAQALPRA